MERWVQAARLKFKWILLPAVLCAGAFVTAPASHADDSLTVDQRLEQLEADVKAQKALIASQQQQLLKQQLQLQSLGESDLQDVRGTGTPEGAPAQGSATPTTATQQPVGVAPADENKGKPPKVTVLSEQGGVLTPKGTLVIEPSVEYEHASTNRLTFRGVELQDTVLIGVVDASAASRNLVSPAVTARYGVTDRLEVEAKIPYVYRSDRETFSIPQTNAPNIDETSNLTGDGLGDIEFGAHYQINGTPPYFIGNVSFKTETGTGPFDIKRDAFGVERDLATGSGFYSLEPNITVIYPSDPAVLFANVGYQWNIKQSVNKNIGGEIVDNFDPGDGIDATVGFGFSVNDRLSFDLGYKHTFLMETDTEVTDTTNNTKRTDKSESLTVGSLLFGLGYRVSDNVNINLDFEYGVTADAPDMTATLRVPIAFNLF
jgi:hypothetical protein